MEPLAADDGLGNHDLSVEEARYTFAEAWPTPRRWIWHPEVHREFDESCFFFLFRMISPQRGTINAQLDGLLRRAGIPNATVYPLLGPYDALVRTWTTEPRRRKLLKEIRASGHMVDQLHEFRSEFDGVRYRWWCERPGAPEMSSDLVRQHSADIRRVAKAQLDNKLRDDADLQLVLRRLDALGLVQLSLDTSDRPRGIKVYIVFDSQYDRANKTQLLRTIDDYIGSHEKFADVSVYQGDGFGRVLVKAVADDYATLVAETEGITDMAAVADFRPMTLVLMPAIEQDSLGALVDELSPTVESLIDGLSDQLAMTDTQVRELTDQFLTMRATDREPYPSLYDEYKDVFCSAQEPTRFAQLLVSLILDNVDQFGDNLVFLQKFESRLRAYLQSAWAKAFQDEPWVEVARDAVAAVEANRRGKERGGKTVSEKNAREWTLGDLESVAAALSAIYPANQQILRIDTDLGSDWRAIVHRVAPIRNIAAHGRIYEYQDLAGFYPTMRGRDESAQIRAILDAARLYLRLNSTVF